jgi:hypothetical protein
MKGFFKSENLKIKKSSNLYALPSGRQQAGNLWGEQDSNLRRHQPADLQSAPVGHFGISPYK